MITPEHLEAIHEASRCLRALVGLALDNGEPFILADVCEAAFVADALDRLFGGPLPEFGLQQLRDYEAGRKLRHDPWRTR